MTAPEQSEPWFASLAPTDPLMRIAWADCLRWVIVDKDALDAFTRDTGVKYVAPRCALDAMIDDASGHSEAVLRAFIVWFNENVWCDLKMEAGQP